MFLKITFLMLCATLPAVIMAQSNGLNFDGTNDHILSNVSGITGSNARTIEARIKTTANALPVGSGGTGQKVLVDWGGTGTGQRSTFNLLWGNAIRFEVAGNGISGSIPVNDGLWHHVAVVIDPLATDLVSMYVDGVLDVSGTPTVSVNSTTTNNIRIGSRIDNTGYFEGEIDEVRVWNVARTQTELQTYMNSELCNLSASLVLYLPMNQGIAGGTNTTVTTATDYGATNGTCTLSGFALTGTTSNWVQASTLTPGFLLGATQTTAACGIYTWPANNQSYVTSGTHQATIPASTGCDSIISLALTINPNTFTTENTSSCGNYLWLANNQTYTTTGQYFTMIPSAAGCDSNITLNLIVGAPTSSNIDTSVCETFTWAANGQMYTSSSLDTAVLINSSGCDSTIALDLTILAPTSSTQIQDACGSYTWPVDGMTYTSSGQYTGTLANAQGCDSLVTLNLTIHQVNLTVSIPNPSTLVSGEANAQYQWIDCSTNQPIAGATSQTFNPPTNGSYAVVVTTANCSDTSLCALLDEIGLDENQKSVYALFPNPSSGKVSILSDNRISGKLTILDARGKVIQSYTVEGVNTFSLDVQDFEDGVYFVQITDQNDNELLRFVKKN